LSRMWKRSLLPVEVTCRRFTSARVGPVVVGRGMHGARADLTLVVHLAVFLIDMKDLAAVNAVWDKYFERGTQASTAVQVREAGEGGVCEGAD
jgi:hypothetical protein